MPMFYTEVMWETLGGTACAKRTFVEAPDHATANAKLKKLVTRVRSYKRCGRVRSWSCVEVHGTEQAAAFGVSAHPYFAGREEMTAVTLADFGNPARRDIIRTHKSVPAARRSFKSLVDIYGPHSAAARSVKPIANNPAESWRCWQELNDGTVINDTAKSEVSHAD